MKNSADLGGCYPPQPSAFVDNTLLDLQNSSYPTQPHSIIAKYSPRRSRGEYSPIFTSLRRINYCFSIITQLIIEIPKQRNVTILPQFAIVDKSSYHAARINVSRNVFLNSRSEEKKIFFDIHTG